MGALREQSGVTGISGDGSWPRVSVIVPARNAERSLPTLLNAFRAQTVPEGMFELLIVDDCSSDGTARVVKDSGIASLVSSPFRGGSACARNLGLAQASAPFIAFTDADCIPAPEWIENGLAAMTQDGPGILVGEIQMPLGRNPTRSALIDVARNFDQEQYVAEGHGATANVWISRSVLETVGLFNPNLISGADTELCRRGVEQGAVIRYEREVVVVHEPRGRARALAQKCFRVGFGAAQHRYHAADTVLRNRPRYWLHPGSYLFRQRVKGLERLEQRGYRFGRIDLLVLRLVQHLCVRVPYAVGNLAGTIAESRKRGSTEPIPRLDALRPTSGR